MAIISIPNTFSAGAVIVAAQHNSNFSTIYSDYNGNVTNANISASAAIVDSKLNQIITAGKVSGAALTSLSSTPGGAGLLPAANLNGAGLTTDLYTTAWTDYTSTSTVTGWSSFTNKSIYYKKIGRLVFVIFWLDGTSNATTASFTVPFAAQTGATGINVASMGYTANNGTQEGNGGVNIASTTVTLSRVPASTAWTASGGKNCQGSLWYEATS